MLYKTRGKCDVIHLCILTQAHARIRFCETNIIVFDLKKSKLILKIISFPESTFKIKVILGRTFSLDLLTAAVKVI